MPRIVDHDERRRVVADAVIDQIVEGGVASVTLKAVAERTGLVIGSIRHYFASTDEMLDFAIAAIVERTTTRVREAVLRPPTDAGELVEVLVRQLPITEQQHAENIAYLEVLRMQARGAGATALAAAGEASEAEFGRWVAAAFPRLPAGDMALETKELVALVNGFALIASLRPEPLDADELRRVLRRHVAQLARE